MRAANGSLGAVGLLGLASACGSAGMDSMASPAQITLTVTSPAPGAELAAAEHPTIAVSGMVSTTDPARGAPLLWVNGVRVDAVAGAFTAELAPDVGINHIKIEAGDGIGDPVARELDVMWAPGYLPPVSGQTGFDLAGALELRLGQRFFDARLLGTALDRTTDPVVARDVASALELILWQVDLAGLIPGGIHTGQGGTSLDLTIPSVAPSDIVVDARIVDEPGPAIDLTIDLIGVFLATRGSFTFSGRTLAVDGGITADLHATARLSLGIAADGSIDVGVTGATASVGPLVPGFQGADGEELDALITLGGADFRTLVEGLLADQLIPTFTGRVPPLVETLLGATDQLLDGVRFTLDAGVGTPVMLQLDGHIGALDVATGATSGHVTVRQDLAVRTSGAPIHPASRGAPRVDAATGAPVFDTSGVHLVMREDFLNALLHALWNAGLLEGPLSSGGLSATVSARLPPVVRPTPASSACKIGGERCDVVLQLGQLEVQLPSFSQSFAINASAGARIEVNGSMVSLAIQDTPELRVWETSPTPGKLTADSVRDLIARIVWPQLFGAIGTQLAIQLPLPDLAALGLGDLAPGLANAQFMLQARQRPSVTQGQLVLGADLVLATPPP
jgi:hypothetical protein